MIHHTLPDSSTTDPYAGPDSFPTPASGPRIPYLRAVGDQGGGALPASTAALHRVPPHCLVGCKIRLMARVTAAEPTGGGEGQHATPSAAPTGVVRFFDQYGLLGVAAVDPDSGIATLPYAFTSGGRRELRAEYHGCAALGASRSTTTSIRIYSAAATITLEDVPAQPFRRD